MRVRYRILKTTLRACSLAVLFGISALSSFGASLFSQPAPFTGTRLEGQGIVTGGQYASDNEVFRLDWNIVQNSGRFDYTYTLSGFDQPELEYLLLDLTDNCIFFQDSCVSNANVDDIEFGVYGRLGNPGFPAGGVIAGVKFDNLPEGVPFILSFTSDRVPVYGDFYLRGGAASFAYNAGLGDRPSDDPAYFIARPDTDRGLPDVPEPASLFLFGGGLASLAAYRWRRSAR